MTTIIKDYEFSTIIGLLDFERVTPQKVRVSAEFESGEFIDYVEMINFIEEIYAREKFGTVESSLEICAKKLKEKFNSLSFLKMEILKIEIVKNATVGARAEFKY